MSRRTPYYQDSDVTLWHGDAKDVLTNLETGSVDCVVTSPPYFGLRDYGVDDQLGSEETPAQYVARLVEVFAAARRVLADDATVWVNLGDTYSGGARTSYDTTSGKTSGRGLSDVRPLTGLPGKNLLGIPWRFALAMQDDGWVLRNDIIWHKPNAMPSSVTDRLSTKHEHVFLFSKQQKYWFDLDAIREPHTPESLARAGRARLTADRSQDGVGSPQTFDPAQSVHPHGKNPGDIWNIPTQPFPGAHFATFPVALPERCIRAGCRPAGVVLDPFSGSGTTGLAASRLGRRYVGIDLNAEYLDLSLRTRLAQPALLIGDDCA